MYESREHHAMHWHCSVLDFKIPSLIKYHQMKFVSVTVSLTFSIVQGIQVRVDLPLYLADYAMAHCNY